MSVSRTVTVERGTFPHGKGKVRSDLHQQQTAAFLPGLLKSPSILASPVPLIISWRERLINTGKLAYSQFQATPMMTTAMNMTMTIAHEHYSIFRHQVQLQSFRKRDA